MNEAPQVTTALSADLLLLLKPPQLLDDVLLLLPNLGGRPRRQLEAVIEATDRVSVPGDFTRYKSSIPLINPKPEFAEAQIEEEWSSPYLNGIWIQLTDLGSESDSGVGGSTMRGRSRAAVWDCSSSWVESTQSEQRWVWRR